MAWGWENGTQEQPYEPQVIGPQPGEIFVALPVEEFAQCWRYFSKQQHIHRCAMLCIDCDEDTAQHVILDYMLANPNVPLFMLDKVPMYLAGYKRALDDQFKRCEKHECICCGMGNNGP